MERLTGLDAAFLALETPRSPMHVGSLAVFDPSTAEVPWSLERIIEVFSTRLHLAPPFRRRLVPVAFGLHHPVWIEDPDFDIRNHIRGATVPAPGGPDEVAAVVSDLVARPLDQRRPLWEVWVLDGLEHGNVALVSKVHHAAIDGTSGNELQVAVLDLSPEIEVHEPEEPWEPEPVPTEAELLAYAAASLARQPVRVVKALRRTTQAALDVRRMGQTSSAATLPAAPFTAPRTSFNAALTPRRSFAYTSLDLRQVKAIRQATACTVNDVVLAICGGALRRYLAARGEVPEAPLVAMVPISVRTADEQGALGNKVSPTFVPLATDVDDPCERLRVIHEVMDEAKAQHEVIGADTLQEWTEFAAPALLGRAVRLYTRAHLADAHRPVFNVTISNVPGPGFPLYSAGARMLAAYPIGPIFDGGGLNMTVMSYLDQLDVGLLACPDLVDDVWEVADHLHAELARLVEDFGVADVDLAALSRVG
ncbi:MAG TPA: wax ester/triacylglycerol synthase family O-acyltransferase [Acidimicrobiales bacterium]|nr:wax ester/triacylglycerol synthase family O-acyltransferase [Acidimicrobiales bacterium]